jgi:glycosyltransferase involved in cell wall biosynthesis
LETHRCGWWVDGNAATLAEALRAATSMPAEERAEMGRRGRELAMQKFAWPRIAEKMRSTYEWALNGGAAPECVRF